MNTNTLITKKEYKTLLKRQEKIEWELKIVKQVIVDVQKEDQINPFLVNRWDRISKDIDSGKGRRFDSSKEMRAWLRSL